MSAVVDVYPLSPVQRGMLVQWLAMPESGFFYSHQIFEITGEFEAHLLERALLEVVSRHESLRSLFSWREVDHPVQVVLEDAPVDLEIHAVREPELETFLEALVAADVRRRIDIETGPLFRVKVIRVDPRRHVVVWGYHHLVLDGWSVAVLLEEVLSIYVGLARGTTLELPAAPSFGDYVAYAEGRAPESLAAWTRALAGCELPTPLGIDMPAPEREVERVRVERRTLGRTLSASVSELARNLRATPWAVTAAAWSVLLARYSGQRSVVFGTTVSGRSAPIEGCERVVGNLLTVVPVRCDVDDDTTVKDLVTSTQRFFVDAEEWQHTGADDIRRALGLGAERALFDSLIVFQNAPRAAVDARLPFTVRSRGARDENAELFTLVVEPGEELVLQAEYREQRFAPDDVRATLARLEAILGRMAADPSLVVGALGVLPDDEVARLEELSAPPAPGSGSRVSPVDMFEHFARSRPDAPFLVEAGETLSYAEALARATRVSASLLSCGAAEELVAVVSDGGVDGVVGVLGALRAGSAFLPMHPSWPEARIGQILRESGARAVVLSSSRHREIATVLAAAVDSPPCIDLDALPFSEAPVVDVRGPSPAPGSLAYVVYTSGSTGTPKGVEVTHASVDYVCRAWLDVYRLATFPVRVVQIGSFACDVFVGDLFKALIAGGSLHLTRGSAARDLETLLSRVVAEGITVLESTPGLCVPLFEYADRTSTRLPHLALVILGADYLRRSDYDWLVSHFGATTRFVNGYGLTEATIESSLFESKIPLERDLGGYAPLGKPFPGTRFEVLDPNGRRVPIGTVGELHVGGGGLARGYLGRPDLTAERFRDDLVAGQRLYRTGDLARWSWDGNLAYVGRSDHQIKIRGFRVELGEVESAIASCRGVDDVAVLAEHAGGATLTAFVAGSVDASSIRAALATKVPEYMIPARFVALATLPRNGNDKIDRLALARQASALRAAPPSAAELGETERAVLAIWADLLGRTDLDPEASFFASGGDSVLVLRLFNRLSITFGVDLNVAELFAHHSVAAQARLVDERRARSAPLPSSTETNTRNATNATDDPVRDLLARLERGEIDVDTATHLLSNEAPARGKS